MRDNRDELREGENEAEAKLGVSERASALMDKKRAAEAKYRDTERTVSGRRPT